MKKTSAVLAKILVIILTLSLLCVSLVALTACNKKDTEKKAIIIVTALFSGGLYDTSTGESFWDPLPGDPNLMDFFNDSSTFIADLMTTDNLSYIMGLLDPILTPSSDPEYVATNDILYNLSLDQNGNSLNPNVKSTTDYAGRQKYGVLNAYKTQYDDLTAKYPDYEVVMFDYDWRGDNTASSVALETFINEKGFTDVVITSHSMGGPVVAGYLARSQANRDKVRAYCPYAGAFLGSVDALYYLESGKDLNGLIGGMIADMATEELAGNPIVQSVIDPNGAVIPKVRTMLENMTSIIQLLPTWEFMQSTQYASEDLTYIDICGERITSKDALYDFYESRTWARLTDENGAYITKTEENKNNYTFSKNGYALKPAVANLRTYHNSLYVNTDDGAVFATTLVNTHYFVGNNVKTKVGVKYTTAGPNENETLVDNSKMVYNMEGDNMVPLYSALGGLSKEYINNAANQTLHECDGKTHVEVGCDWAYLKDATYAIIDAALAD